MQRKVFELAQEQYTKAGGGVTALACSTVTRDDGQTTQTWRRDATANTSEGATSSEDVKQLLVGLNDGRVEEYRFDTKRQGSNLELYRTVKVGKKSIDQVCVISSGSSKALCALSGGVLWLLPSDDSGASPTQVKAGALRGLFYIAQDLCNLECRNLLGLCKTSLAPGLPKKLKLVFLEVGSFAPGGAAQFHVLHEQVIDAKDVVPSSAHVREAVWYGDSVLLRTDKNYVQFSLSTGVAREIFAHNNKGKGAKGQQAGGLFSGGSAQDQGGNEVCAHQYMIPIVEQKQTILLVEDIGTIVNMAGEPTGSMVQFPIEPMAIHAMCFPYLLAVFAKSVYVYDIRKDLRDAHVQTIPFSNYFLSPTKVDRVPVTSWTSVTPSGENQIFIMVGHSDMLLFLSQTPLEEQCKEMLRASKFQECLQIAYTSQLPKYREYLIEFSCAEAAFLLIERLEFSRALEFLGECQEFEPNQLFPLFPEYTKPWKTQVKRKRYWSMHPPLCSLEDLVGRATNNEGAGGAHALPDREIKVAIVDFVLELRARTGEGEETVLADGVDTLLAHLLLDVEDVKGLEALCKGPNKVLIPEVEKRFCSSGRIHALALLRESQGDCFGAAELWTSLSEGKRSELPTPGAFLTGKSLGDAVSLELARVVKRSGPGARVTGTFLPWLMDRSVEVSLKLLADISLPVGETMAMVNETKRTSCRWRYLDFVVNVQGSTDPMHHSEFALSMVNLWKSLESGEGEAEEVGGATAEEVCTRLQDFLEHSDYYNTQAAISALKGTTLWREQVIVNKKIGNHKEALHILTFVIGDSEAGVSYCEDLGSQEGYLTLLDMLLNPETGPPLYGEAVRLLSSKGASLNPLKVLDSLSDKMPMPLAYETLARMLRERQHRKRSGQVLKGLARANELSVAQQRVVSLSEHVEMTADRACRVCNIRIGTKVFGLYPNGVLVCYRCMMRSGKDAQHVCPVTGRDFSKEEGWGDCI
ncbi:transforming growth factor-beta receptor-associated protein [Chloropicon primus]|nr:transforming growth factor-beta receptor-associated protein [Chloropicon primus]